MVRRVTAKEYAKELGCVESTARIKLKKIALRILTQKKPVIVYGVDGHQQVKVKQYIYEIPDED